MKYLWELIDKHIDFHLALALVAILGTAGSLYLQFGQADLEFDALNSSIYSVAQGRDPDTKENSSLNSQLDQLEKQFEALDVQDRQMIK